MKRILVIPIIKSIDTSLRLAEEYSAGFEFNDFFMHDVLDSREKQESITARYKALPLPVFRTVHGAFFDVTVFSPDPRIREVSHMRVKQSIDAAEGIGASAVVFHTNYNPFLSGSEYIESWVNTNADYWSGILTENPRMDIYIENMFDTDTTVIEKLSERLCGYKNYGVCLDWAHAALSGKPLAKWAENLGRYVKHIHINDNNFDCDSHLALGDGKIDWNGFYRLYERYMPDASVLAEMSDVSRQEKSLRKLRQDKFID